MERSIKLSLLENSHAFLKEAVANALAAGSDPHRWQFAILHLVQAVELSLKAALHRVHPVLVFADIDATSFRTVTLLQAMDRLRNPRIAGKRFAAEDIDKIKAAAKARNNITHSEFELTYEYAAAKFFGLLPFALTFQQQSLGVDPIEVIRGENFNALMAVQKAFQELVAHAKQRIRDEGVEPGNVWVCPNCEQDTFVVSNGEDACYTCRNSTPVVECPQCSKLCFLEEIESFANELDTDYSEGVVTIHNDYGYQTHEACPDCLPKIRETIDEKRRSDMLDWLRDSLER